MVLISVVRKHRLADEKHSLLAEIERERENTKRINRYIMHPPRDKLKKIR